MEFLTKEQIKERYYKYLGSGIQEEIDVLSNISSEERKILHKLRLKPTVILKCGSNLSNYVKSVEEQLKTSDVSIHNPESWAYDNDSVVMKGTIFLRASSQNNEFFTVWLSHGKSVIKGTFNLFYLGTLSQKGFLPTQNSNLTENKYHENLYDFFEDYILIYPIKDFLDKTLKS